MSGTVSQTDGEVRVAAIYARVSSERQRQDQTIQSQIAALRELAVQRGLLVPEDLLFEDDGFSGASLQRPALERLRDRAFDGCFEVLLCHAPDRLARRYAYQVLLLEELARGGIEVVFLKEPERSGSPEDELMRQFQGMIAEYERAQIAERCRRGKLHRARAGAVSVLSNAPYGYRYVKKTEHADAFFEVDELEAPIVREIFDRYVERSESIGQIARALTEQGVPTRTGAPCWGPSTILAILRNPAYTGQAAYGRRRVTGAPAKPMRATRQRGRHSGRSAYQHVGAEHWLRIPVPALITEQQHALAQQLLERNSRLSPRNTRRPSLLQGILVCGECGHSYHRSSQKRARKTRSRGRAPHGTRLPSIRPLGHSGPGPSCRRDRIGAGSRRFRFHDRQAAVRDACFATGGGIKSDARRDRGRRQKSRRGVRRPSLRPRQSARAGGWEVSLDNVQRANTI